MKNIFKKAKFGKPYKTRDGRKAIFYMRTDFGASLLTEKYGLEHYHFDGVIFNCIDERDNIVSEWQEKIDEEEHDEFAKEYLSENSIPHEAFLKIREQVAAYYRKEKKGGDDEAI